MRKEEIEVTTGETTWDHFELGNCDVRKEQPTYHRSQGRRVVLLNPNNPSLELSITT